jgi:hypothetical protein
MAKNVIEKLLALEDDLDAFIELEEDARIIAPLVNIQGALSQLHDSLRIKAHFEGTVE